MGSGSRRLLCPTLVARDDELAVLGELRANAAASRGETILIGGDAGVGKSALVRRFADSARAAASRVLLGECTEIEARRPLGPLLDAIEQGRRAGYIRPDDADRLSPLLMNTGDETLQPRLYQGITRLFAGIARGAPLVLVIEDLHWADQATLEVFAFLARRLRNDAAVVLGTYRTDELHRRHPLRPYIAQLVAARAVREMTLAPLRGRAVTQFIRETLHLGEDPPHGFRDAVDQRCEGNPFFMEETLDALRARGQLSLTDGRWLPAVDAAMALPDTVRDAVERRLQSLDADTVHALRIAAVIGQRFDFELLAEIGNFANERLIEHLRAAIAAQIVVEHDARGVFAFRHALTRESVMADLLEPERRALHLRIAAALERREGPDEIEQLAYHFDEGGDAKSAFAAHLRAAEKTPFAARAEALKHIRRAVELAPDDADQIALHARLALAELDVDMERGVRALEDVVRSAEAVGRVREAGDALASIAMVRVNAGDPRAGVDARRAVEMLEPLGSSLELAKALNQLGRWYIFSGEDPQLGRETAARGERVAREVGAIGQALGSRVTSVLYDGDPQGQADVLRAVIDEARATGSVGQAFRAYNNLFVTYSDWPGPERERLFDEWSQFCESAGFENPGFARSASLHWMRVGDFDRALRYATQAGEFLDQIGLPGRFRAELIRVARDGPSAGSTALRAIDTSSRIADSKFAVLLGSVELLLLQGEPERVLTLPNLDMAESDVLVAALCAAHVAGDEDATARLSHRVAALPDEPYPSRYLDGERAYAAGDPAGGARLMEEVGWWSARIDCHAIAAAVRLRSIDLLRGHDARLAAEMLARVVAYWRLGKATWYLLQLERWARDRKLAFPVDARPAAPARPTKSLTDREIEVARLVGLGLTNKDIADRLVISERTAEGHVQRILDKLGFRSRSQIAAWHASGRVEAVAPRAN